MKKIVLSAKFETFIDESNLQFSESKGLHLNSSDWKPYIKMKHPDIFKFVSSGLLVSYTNSEISKKTYQQGYRNTEYRTILLAGFYLSLIGVSNDKITDFLTKLMKKTNWRIRCNCPAMVFWGFNYILTKENSILGPGESRKPVKRNPHLDGICCKHLWVSLNYLHQKMEEIVKNILLTIRNFYGVQSEHGRQQVLKKVKITGLKKLLNDVKTAIIKIDKSLSPEFDNISKGIKMDYFGKQKEYKKDVEQNGKETETINTEDGNRRATRGTFRKN